MPTGDIGGPGWKRYDDPEEKAFKLNAERNNGGAADPNPNPTLTRTQP